MRKDQHLFQSLEEFSKKHWEESQDYDGLQSVVFAISEGIKRLIANIQGGLLNDIIGSTDEVNIQGEIVQKLDSLASDTFVETLRKCGNVAAVGSEEIAETVVFDDGPHQRYLVQMDPLDGSSNIDVGVSIGSIFGIWKRKAYEAVVDSTMLRSGREQIAAVYSIYGSGTNLVVATRDNVQGFTLDPKDQTFRLTNPHIRIPEQTLYYSVNEGNFANFDLGTQRAVQVLRDSYSLRYGGCLVSDFHRNLLKGGIFLYPGTRKNPDGKLRLMYEANPLGFIAEQAGGSASSGRQRILDIVPENLHQRVPLIIGTKKVVDRIVAMIQGQ